MLAATRRRALMSETFAILAGSNMSERLSQAPAQPAISSRYSRHRSCSPPLATPENCWSKTSANTPKPTTGSSPTLNTFCGPFFWAWRSPTRVGVPAIFRAGVATYEFWLKVGIVLLGARFLLRRCFETRRRQSRARRHRNNRRHRFHDFAWPHVSSQA